jgi:predicted SAM-dependent methyltransferase
MWRFADCARMSKGFADIEMNLPYDTPNQHDIPLVRASRRGKGARIAIVTAIERGAGWIHRAQRFVPSQSPVKVNLGSGLFVASGWVNIDGSIKALIRGLPEIFLRRIYPLIDTSGTSEQEFIRLLRDNIFVHHNLKYGVPLPDSCADFVYSSHMLHHLYRDTAGNLLREVLRVLKPGGTVRLTVPDLEYIFSLYQQGKREQALKYFFYTEPRGELFSRRYQYDFSLLRALLSETGFGDITRCAFREGRTPDLERLDRLPEQSLFVEARRFTPAVQELSAPSDHA